MRTGAFSLAIKRLGRQADHWCPSTAEVESNVPCAHKASTGTPLHYL